MADFTPVEAGKTTDVAKNNILDVYLKGAPVPTLYLGLFKNTTEPLATATLADIIEPSGGDYVRQMLAPGDWIYPDPAIYNDPTDTRWGVATNPVKSFFNTGVDWGNIYGFFICTSILGTDGKLIRVEKFLDGPYNVTVGGGIRVLPQLSIS